MQRIMWYALLAGVALVAPIDGQMKTPQSPQPKTREIATIPGIGAREAVWLPNGRVFIYAADDADKSVFAYDLASKRSTLVARGFYGELAISRKGDRIVFDHFDEGSKREVIWSVPINPATGAAAGPAQRASLSPGGNPSLSPDGTLIAFEGSSTGNDLTVVPATGGAERVVAKNKGAITWTSWSDDGKSIYVVWSGAGAPLVGCRDSRMVVREPIAGGPSEQLISFCGRMKGLVGGRIAFYYADSRAPLEGRLAYKATSGASGEINVPTFPPSQGGSITGQFETPLWLWATHTTPSEGPPTSTIYELDMTPILKAIVKR